MLAWMGGKRKKFELWKKDSSRSLGIRKKHPCLKKVSFNREYEKLAAKTNHFKGAGKVHSQHAMQVCSRKTIAAGLQTADQRSVGEFSLNGLGILQKENNLLGHKGHEMNK